MKWIIELFLEFWTEPKQNQKEHLVYLLCRFSTRATVYALFFAINFNLTKFLWFYLSSSSLVCMCHECGYVRARAPARAFVCVRLSMVFFYYYYFSVYSRVWLEFLAVNRTTNTILLKRQCVFCCFMYYFSVGLEIFCLFRFFITVFFSSLFCGS